MPGLGQPIVVGGGLQLSGGAINEFLILTSVTPPVASTTPRLRRSGNDVIAESTAAMGNTVLGPTTTVPATQAAASAGVLIGNTVNAPGFGDYVVIGRAMAIGAATNGDLVAIGSLSTGANFVTQDSVMIGQDMSLGTTNQNNSVLIGTDATSNTQNYVCIGQGASVGGGNFGGAVAIGQLASAPQHSISIGNAATGGTATSLHNVIVGHDVSPGANISGAIALGNRSTAAGMANNTMYLGHQDNTNSIFTTAVWIGGGPTHVTGVAVPAFTMNFRNALGTDIAANSVTVLAPRATGNAAPGAIVFQTGVPGASGTAQSVMADVVAVRPATATQPRHIDVMIDKGLFFTNQTSGAGAAVGTLTNAPTAGDPAFWIRTRINGTDHFIPAWT